MVFILGFLYFIPHLYDRHSFECSSKLEGWIPSCRLSDKANDQLKQWLADDNAMEQAIDAEAPVA